MIIPHKVGKQGAQDRSSLQQPDLATLLFLVKKWLDLNFIGEMLLCFTTCSGSPLIHL